MFAGNLNEIITVEQPVAHKNELGEVVDCLYAKKFTTKAQVIYRSGSRVVDNSEIFTEYAVQFVIRHYLIVSETDRVLYRDRKYRIESIEYSREYQLIKLNCTLINE